MAGGVVVLALAPAASYAQGDSTAELRLEWASPEFTQSRSTPALAAGGLIGGAVGAVGGFYVGALLELEELVAAGLTPFEALSAGTRNAGAWLEQSVPGAPAVGTIEPGKVADLVLVAENPLENISATRGIRGVVLRGRWMSRTELDALR